MMTSPANNSQSSKNTVVQIVVCLLACVGAVAIVSGLFPKTHYELDHGGYIAMIQTSWWGIKSDRYLIRLQHHADWKQGRPYRSLPQNEELDWFIRINNEEWYPMDFLGPPDP